MAQAVESSVRNAGAALREQLAALEKWAVAPTVETVAGLLAGMDAAQAALVQAEAEGLDVRPEQVRFDNLARRLAARPRLIARAAAHLPGGMGALRAAHPPAAAPWWQADRVHAGRVRRTVRDVVLILASVVALLALVYWVINTFFPPDPRAVAMLEASNELEERAAAGDWAGGLQVAEAAFAQYPDAPELALWVGVLAEKANQPARAAQAFADAQRLTQDFPAHYWILRSDVYARALDDAQALAAAQQAVKLAPEDPQATFMLGKAAAATGDRATAIEYLDKTYTLAEDSNPQLAVNARVLYAGLLQQIDMPTPAPTLTP